MNLLSNAIDALHEYGQCQSLATGHAEQGTIWIRTDMIEPDWVRISIIDNGPGLTEDVRSRLFEPFFTTKPVGKGTGLGLSISLQIVTEKHHGKLYCHSKPGQGTEFVIELPVSAVVPAAMRGVA